MCGTDLHAWAAAKTTSDTKRIKVLHKQVEFLTKSELTETTKADFVSVSKELDELLLKQEIYWAQRSHILWLRHGNKNTKYFQSKASQRRRWNFIQGI